MNKQSALEAESHKLKQALLAPNSSHEAADALLVERAREVARAYSQVTDAIAVISDYHANVCHIYSGLFGQCTFGLPAYLYDDRSAFEDVIFRKVEGDDLMERHVMELRFLKFLEQMTPAERTHYQASCAMRLAQSEGRQPVLILHTTRTMYSAADGTALCGICTYAPMPQQNKDYVSCIVNIATGQTVERRRYEDCGSHLLSRRQLEVLSLLAKGLASKQISQRLYISLNTVNRHRQDILSALRVNNTAAAVETALRMHII